MGILNALGLMTRAEHDKAVLRIERERDKFRDQVRDTCARAERAEKAINTADNQTKAAVASRDEWKAKFNNAAKDLAKQSDEIAALKTSAELDNDTILGLRSQLEAAEQIIASLKPDAEAMRRRRANDAKRVRPSRAKAKVASETVKTGAATGKPRTAIPAKVGGGSAKLSGDRPAKKASGK